MTTRQLPPRPTALNQLREWCQMDGLREFSPCELANCFRDRCELSRDSCVLNRLRDCLALNCFRDRPEPNPVRTRSLVDRRTGAAGRRRCALLIAPTFIRCPSVPSSILSVCQSASPRLIPRSLEPGPPVGAGAPRSSWAGSFTYVGNRCAFPASSVRHPGPPATSFGSLPSPSVTYFCPGAADATTVQCPQSSWRL